MGISEAPRRPAFRTVDAQDRGERLPHLAGQAQGLDEFVDVELPDNAPSTCSPKESPGAGGGAPATGSARSSSGLRRNRRASRRCSGSSTRHPERVQGPDRNRPGAAGPVRRHPRELGRGNVISLVPAVEGRCRQRFGALTGELTSHYRYFETQPIRRSTEALSFVSHSQWWRTGRTSTTDSRSTHSAGSSAPASTSHAPSCSTAWSSHSGRIISTHRSPVRDRPPGCSGRSSRIGIGGSYFWSDHFSGWSVGGQHPAEVLIMAAARAPRAGGPAPLDLRAPARIGRLPYPITRCEDRKKLSEGDHR